MGTGLRSLIVDYLTSPRQPQTRYLDRASCEVMPLVSQCASTCERFAPIAAQTQGRPLW